jgi:hypothetical protein
VGPPSIDDLQVSTAKQFCASIAGLLKRKLRCLQFAQRLPFHRLPFLFLCRTCPGAPAAPPETKAHDEP